jgi:hypothetical protein
MEDRSAKQERDAMLQSQLKAIGSDKVAGTDEKLKLRKVRVIQEFSVFVGNFRDQDEARATLAKIKEFAAPTSIPAYGFEMFDTPNMRVQADPAEHNSFGIFGLKMQTRAVQSKKLAQSRGNPFHQSFICRNPLQILQQPTVRQATNEVDPLWKALNKDERYSIFTCPKPWTLVVAQFQPPMEVFGAGTSVFQRTGYAGQAYGRELEYCAEQARKLADILRDGGRGYDAYVFHTANRSLVTIGAFETRTDENMEKAFYALANFAASQKTPPFSCLMKFPQPMQVPGK